MSPAVSGGRHLFAATEAWDNNWQLLTICQESQHCHFQAQSGEGSLVIQADYLNIILFSVTIFPSWTEDDTIKMSSGLSADILCVMSVTMLWSPRHPGYHPSLPGWCWPAEVVKISLHYTSPVPVWNCDSSTPVQCTLHPAAILLKWWWEQNNSLFHQAYGIHPSSYLFCIAQLLMAVVKHLTSQH